MPVRLPLSRAHLLERHFPITSTLKMPSFKLQNSDITVDIPEHITEELTKNALLEFPAFKNWISTLRHNLSLQTNKSHEFSESPYKIEHIQIQSVDKFSSSQIGFIKLKATVKNNQGESLPGSVFLRGASVGMMVVLQPDDMPKGSQEEKHVILTVQPRIPAGTLRLVELPAGMVDNGTFSGSAAREIQEELGLEIPEEELTNLSELAIPKQEGDEKLPQAMFPSGGGSDEYVPIFLHERRVKRDTLKEWTGKLTGLREHGEKISLKLCKLEDLWKEGGRDSKALAAWAMYEGLKRDRGSSEGKGGI